MPKYRDYFRKMLETHQKEFEEFSAIHAQYTLDQTKHQQQFNKVGEKIQHIIRDWENRLCGHSEKGKFNKFSARLAEKFQAEIKAFYPMIDFIGVEISQSATKPQPQADRPLAEATSQPDPDLLEIEQLSLDNVDDFNLKKLL